MVSINKVKHVYKDTTSTVTLLPLGDLHVGNKAADKRKIEKTIKFIVSNVDYWIGMGDYCDAIAPHPDEKRFDFEALDRELLTPDEQYNYIYNLFYPIRQTCLGLLSGNHDYVLSQRNNHAFVDELAAKLGVKPLGYSSFLRFKFQRDQHRTTIDLFAHHGFYSGRTKGGKINRVRTLDQIFDADIYCMAHVHDFNPDFRPYLKVDNHMHIIEERKYYVLTGGFLRGWFDDVTTYVERGMFAPTTLGSPIIIFYPEKNRFPWIKIEEVPT